MNNSYLLQNVSDFNELYTYKVKIIYFDNITTTESMFLNCDKIIEIDLSKFNTTQVNNMNNIFSGCFSLTSLYLSNFNTSIVKNMSFMFDITILFF